MLLIAFVIVVIILLCMYNMNYMKIIGILLISFTGWLMLNHDNINENNNEIINDYYGGGSKYKNKLKLNNKNSKLHLNKKNNSIHIEHLLKFKLKRTNNTGHTDVHVDDDLLHCIETNSSPSVNHIPPNALISNNFTRCITDSSPEIKYTSRVHDFKRSLHWGQLKLMLTEIEYLTIVMKQYKDKRPIYFVYAGAAPGHHIKFLSDMFDKVHFELYDPNKFVVKDDAMIKTHVEYFTDDVARHWSKQKDKFVIFCSDIRLTPATEEQVIKDMAMQLKWWEIMNPEFAMFKFRLPWRQGRTLYPKGEIYIQPFPGPTSTETRLIVKKNAPIIEYNNTKYESNLYYHNTTSRFKKYHCILGNLDLKSDHLDNCYDCVSFINIAKDYLQFKYPFMKDVDLKQKTYKLVQDIQNEITKKHNIYSQTIKSLNKFISLYNTWQFNPSNKKVYN